jgi:hypothetical protein
MISFQHIMSMFCALHFSAELLGLPLVPAYSEASRSVEQLLQGVNYASAAAGILDDSGGNFVSIKPSMIGSSSNNDFLTMINCPM